MTRNEIARDCAVAMLTGDAYRNFCPEALAHRARDIADGIVGNGPADPGPCKIPDVELLEKAVRRAVEKRYTGRSKENAVMHVFRCPREVAAELCDRFGIPCEDKRDNPLGGRHDAE